MSCDRAQLHSRAGSPVCEEHPYQRLHAVAMKPLQWRNERLIGDFEGANVLSKQVIEHGAAS